MQSTINDMDFPAINLSKSDDNCGHGIECRSTKITGEMLRSPTPASAANPSIVGLHSSHDSRPYCANSIIDDECIINTNRNVPSGKPMKSQIHLLDELELLRTENFQLRLRVYNAEQRVDRLSAATLGRNQKKPSAGTDNENDGTDTDSEGTDTDSDGTDTDSDGSDIDSDDTNSCSGHVGSGNNQNNTAAKAKMAKAAMNSIHDLLELNRRLLALMAATVSAKSASVLADSKRRLQKLQSHIEKYDMDDPNKRKQNETCEDDDDDSDDEFFDASATNCGTLSNVTRQNVLRLPPPPSFTPLDTVSMDKESVGSDVTALQGQCRPIRSAQQLTRTDLWVRNRKFGNLGQKRCMTQVADAGSVHAGSDTGQKNGAAKATTEVTMHTIHELLTLNQRLLRLMAATVSGKSVSISADNKRSLQQLQSHIEKYAIHSPSNEKANEDNDDEDDSDDEYFDASATNSGTFCKAWLVSANRSVTRQDVLRWLPPPPQPKQPPPSKSLEGVGSEVTRQRRQCTPIRSVHQLMKTELWARNRMFFGKVEQQQIMTQVSYAGVHMDRRLAKKAEAAAAPPQQHNLQQFCMKTAALTASQPPTKGVLVIRPGAKTPSTSNSPEAGCIESQIAVATITTHPLLFPDHPKVNFFISCDEEEEDDDDDCYEDFVETNCTSSSEEDTADWNNCGEEPALLAAVGAPVASSASTRRHCRTHQPIKGLGDSATVTMMTSSSPVSAIAEIEANELKRNGVITADTIATSPCTVSVGNDLNKRRRCMLPRRCFNGGVDVANNPRPSSMVDAQVQCDDGNVVVDHTLPSSNRGDGELQLLQLRRELDALQRKNNRLNDMLLRFQQGTRPGDSGPRIPSSSVHEGTVNDSIANLFPPLMSVDDDDDNDDVGGGDGNHQRCRPDGVKQQLQLQLTRIRERIVEYEHQELDSGENHTAAIVQQMAKPEPGDPFNDAVRHMNHTDLVTFALPKVVERLHRALLVLRLQPENVAAK